MKKIIIIEASNNNDYNVSSIHEIDDVELEMIMPIINAIKAFDEDKTIEYQKFNWLDEGWEGINWKGIRASEGEYPTAKERYFDKGGITEEAWDCFNNFTPYFETGINDINFITILVVQEEIKLL